jgi:HEPN domain-containing protein
MRRSDMGARDEVTASVRAAYERLEDARSALDRGRYHDCAYHSASAAKDAGNVLIPSLGGRVPRTRRGAGAIMSIAARLKPEFLKDEQFARMLGSLRDLEVHVVGSRHPIEIKMGLLFSWCVLNGEHGEGDVAEGCLCRYVGETFCRVA